ncbi:MAG: IPT/TIG domain-containing protein [Patescibacteria group bacterium]|nr:IPT/TIG domain-containing protein [Patescibacteria group bacterium]
MFNIAMQKIFFITFSASSLFLVSMSKVQAQAAQELGIDELADAGVYLGTRSIQETIALVINIFLGFLGTLAVLLLLYGGFLWMTSRGATDKIQRAKMLIISAVIGLVIILASYGIARFVLNQLYDATGPGTPGTPGNGIPPPGGQSNCPAPLNPDNPIICSTNRQSGPPGASITIRGRNFDTNGNNNPDADGRVLLRDAGGAETVAELVVCGGTTANSWSNTRVNVRVPLTLTDGLYTIHLYNDLGNINEVPPGLADFVFNVDSNVTGPDIHCLNPDSATAPINVDIEGIGFGNTQGSLSMLGWLNDQTIDLTNTDLNISNWTDNLINFQVPANALSSQVVVEVGGQSDNEFFTVECSSGNDCSSGCCRSNSCLPAAICAGSGTPGGPRIDSISPDNGNEGNLITIYGSGFGDLEGVVTFDAGAGATVNGIRPADINNQCSNTWTDNYIVIAVPAAAVNGLLTITKDISEGGETSNGVQFTRNNIDRPGICRLDPLSGAFETSVTIHGLKFADNSQIHFGNFQSSVVNFSSQYLYTAQVPNVVGNVGVVIESPSEEESNSYPFTALSQVSGLPIINSVSPNSGPIGQYVTIMGANFGNTQGRVLFGSIDGDFSFPAICGGNYWRNDRIIVKVPSGLPLGGQPIRVIRNSDQAESNSVNFQVLAGLPGPQICNVSPDNGPIGTAVTFVGENFGATMGSVIFYNGALATPSIWNNNQIMTSVPNNAQTGLAIVRDNNNTESNPWPFNVGNCTSNQQCMDSGLGNLCCPTSAGSSCMSGTSCDTVNFCEYTWSISSESGNLEVLSHSPDCDGACTTSELMVRFNREIDQTTFNHADINDIRVLAGATLVTPVVHSFSGNGQYLHVQLPIPLQPGVVYSVTLGQGFTDILGNALAADYSWDFTTGNDQCVISNARVTPSTYTSSLTNQIVNYRLNAISSTPQCGETIVYCQNCTYNWALGAVLPDSSAANIASGQNQQIVGVQNLLLAGQGSAEVLGTIIDGGQNFVSQGELLMDISGSMQTPLAITNYWPNCDGMCLDPIIRVEFNRSVLPATLNISNIAIYQGAPNGSNIFNDSVVFSPNNRRMDFGYNGPLLPGETYYIVLSSGFISDGNSTVSLSWNFSTGDSQCVVSGADVDPDTQLSTQLGQLSRFDATAMASNIPNCGPVPVYCPNCTYQWSLSNTTPSGAASIPGSGSNSFVQVRNDLPALESGSTNVDVLLTDPIAGSFSDFGLLTIDNSGTTVSYNTPTIIGREPIGQNICTNVSPYLDFSERMNEESIRNNIKLYREDNGSYIEVPGSFRFVTMNLDDDPERETRAIFNPSSLLPADTQFWMAIIDASQVVSQNNIPLDLAGSAGLSSLPPGLSGEAGWSFSTGGQTCRVHNAWIAPTPDWFTCTGRNDCPDDASPLLGNQRSYEAFVYSISGQLLNNSLLNFTWSLSNSLATLAAAQLPGNTLVTSGSQNGQVTLGAGVSSPDDGSSTTASGLINLFFCENPWPSLPGFPWNESTYNFSTFYCQYSGLPGSTSLPHLQYLPTPRDNFSTDGLREYIFTINPSITSSYIEDVGLGSLAFASDSVRQRKQAKENPFNRLLTFLGIGSAQGQEQGIDLCIPNAPRNLQVTAVTDDSVSLSWLTPSSPSNPLQLPPSGFRVYRRVLGGNYVLLNTLPTSTLNYTDASVASGQTYEYIVASYADACAGGDDQFSRSSPVVVTVADVQPGIDIIGIRIMRNDQHLSVRDWFLRHAPNPNIPGILIEVDGYQALQVGSTIYIAGTNISGNLYTNIYILAHNIGARPDTINIFSQFVDNLKLNINITQNNNNVCEVDASIACSSDFDCEGRCLSQGLKLRRDTKRLADLVSIALRLEEYGQSHKACSGNSLMACAQDNDCPGTQTCRPYYPILGAGTYVQGMSTSPWPSWQDAFSSALGSLAAVDPINRFNGCPEGADPATCWNQSVDPNTFVCPQNSLVYLYNVLSGGQDYDLGANFEYDIYPAQYNINFVNRLRPTLSSLGINVNLGLVSYCNATNLNAPGGPASPYCGNGIVDGNEQCDGGFINACPANYDWWTPRMVGCNPPGTIGSNGNDISCTWYVPDPPFGEAECGGYCGDGTIQSYYEQCEGNNFAGDFICQSGHGLFCGQGCQAMCNQGPNAYPAARCGDGVWSAGIEQCDSSASPSGLSTWGCTNGGVASCNSSCQVTCSVGAPYAGYCGDGIVQAEEQCDYMNYSTPSPHDSGPNLAYACNTLCQFTSQYCGDGTLQSQFGENCDYLMNYSTPSPPNSTPFNQYACRPHGVGYFTYNGLNYGACSPTYGGWCGDGVWDLGNDEFCDPGDPWRGITQSPAPPSPDQSSQTNQYSCRADCLARIGGYCGDGIAQLAYSEVCDGLHYPNRPLPAQSGPDNTYTCDMTGSFMCQRSDPSGPYCGDGIRQVFFGEGCDWGPGGNNPPGGSFPWPRGSNFANFSSPNNQYECVSCGNTGGWCGDGIVQQWEQCDTGFDPAVQIEKDIDIVYVFDVSGSMYDRAVALCSSLQQVVNNLDSGAYGDIDYRISIFVMGDNDGGIVSADGSGVPGGGVYTNPVTPTYLTPITIDDIPSLSPWLGSAGWLDESQVVFKALYTDCPLRQAPYNQRVRYLSFYNNSSNDINSEVSADGDQVLYGERCQDYLNIIGNPDPGFISGHGDAAGRLSNWGYAMTKIIPDYNWLPGYHRLLIPVSDEGGYCGSNASILRANENCNPDTSFGSGTHDVLAHSIDLANSQNTKVAISPVLFTNFHAELAAHGQCLADGTGGRYLSSTTGWSAATISVINSTFCDGRGDGFMDCTLPTP